MCSKAAFDKVNTPFKVIHLGATVLELFLFEFLKVHFLFYFTFLYTAAFETMKYESRNFLKGGIWRLVKDMGK